MDFTKVKIITFAPIDSADEVRKALGESGAGIIGDYTFCSFSSIGKGRYVPGVSSNPHIGEPSKPETVEEERIEVVCDLTNAKQVIAALKKVHPYEEVAFDVFPILTEDQL